MKGLIDLIFFILMNIGFCIIVSVHRRTPRHMDFASIAISAIAATALFHLVAVVEDFRAVTWLMISVPIALGLSLLVSALTNVVVQMYITRKRRAFSARHGKGDGDSRTT